MKKFFDKIKKFFGFETCNHEYSLTLEFGHFENEYGIKVYTYTKCIHCENIKIHESHTFKRNEYETKTKGFPPRPSKYQIAPPVHQPPTKTWIL